MVSMQEIRRYCDAIAAAFQPQRIILFGSYAYGKPTADSDVDVMVVMPKSKRMGRRPDDPAPVSRRRGWVEDVIMSP